MDLISVIVPVYKVESYLDRCVQSIVDQTYSNLEIILVDDGSPDRCPEICDAWSDKDNRIRVIHQENAGAGAARNTGIAAATGEFIAFVDSDDCLAPQMYEHLISAMDTDTDIVECDFFTTEDVSPVFSPIDKGFVFQSYTAEEALKLHISDKLFRQIIWNKLYRRYAVASIQFPTGKLIDDEFWTYQVLGNAKKLKHSSAKLYAYMQQSESVMHISYSLRRLQAIEAKGFRLKYLSSHFPALLSQGATNLWATCIYHGQMSLKHLDTPSQKKAFSILKETVVPVFNCAGLKQNLTVLYRIWFLLSKINFKGTCRLRNFLKIGL